MVTLTHTSDDTTMISTPVRAEQGRPERTSGSSETTQATYRLEPDSGPSGLYWDRRDIRLTHAYGQKRR